MKTSREKKRNKKETMSKREWKCSQIHHWLIVKMHETTNSTNSKRNGPIFLSAQEIELLKWSETNYRKLETNTFRSSWSYFVIVFRLVIDQIASKTQFSQWARDELDKQSFELGRFLLCMFASALFLLFNIFATISLSIPNENRKGFVCLFLL